MYLALVSPLGDRRGWLLVIATIWYALILIALGSALLGFIYN